MATRRSAKRGGTDDTSPKAKLAPVNRSLESGIGGEVSGKVSDRTVTIATGLQADGKDLTFEVRLVVTQENGHTDHSGRRERRGHPTDTVTRFRVIDPASQQDIASGSFGNGNGRRDHVVTTAARSLLSWVNQQLALEPVGS